MGRMARNGPSQRFRRGVWTQGQRQDDALWSSKTHSCESSIAAPNYSAHADCIRLDSTSPFATVTLSTSLVSFKCPSEARHLPDSFTVQVGFVQDPQHKKLGDRTGPWAEPRPKEEMLTDYSDFNEPCLKLLRSIEDPSIWGIFHSQPIDSPQDDRVILIGDAVSYRHSTHPR